LFNTGYRQRGFTLGELLTTMTVIGLSLSFAVPGFNTIINNNRRATGINQLVSTMYLARSEAITRNTQITVCPSTNGVACQAVGWNQGWLLFADTNRDRAIQPGELILGHMPAQTRLEIQSAEFGTFFVYRPNGRLMVNTPAENTGQMTICDPRGAEHARVLIVNTSGHPRLSEYQSDGSTPVCP
jgi:type IV fimbrial biogenesis protein FimT